MGESYHIGIYAMTTLSDPITWLILVNLIFFAADLMLSVPSIKKRFFKMPRILQRAFVIPIAVPPCVLPLFPQPRFELLALPASVMGAILLITGVVLLVSAFRQIGVIPSAIPEEARGELITAGVYGMVRNPIYSAEIALVLGSSLLFRGLYALAYAPIVFILFLWITILEEKELKESFGNRYLEYKRQVPYLFIPGIV